MARQQQTADHSGITAEQYPAECRQLADKFGLTPVGDIIIGPEQMFWNFQRDGQVVGLDWDIWLEFMAVAQSPVSEPLVAKIAEWLARSQNNELHLPQKEALRAAFPRLVLPFPPKGGTPTIFPILSYLSNSGRFLLFHQVSCSSDRYHHYSLLRLRGKLSVSPGGDLSD